MLKTPVVVCVGLFPISRAIKAKGKVMNGLLVVWKAMKGSAKTLLTVGFVLSLAVNILMFTSSVFVTAASSVLSTTLGIKSVFARQADDLAELTVDIDHERRINRQLRSEATEVRGAADNILRRVARRTSVSATRDVASMPAEAIPYLGAAVIVGATALEIHDMCQNLQDLAELQQLIDPSSAPAPEKQTVCALEVPTRSEVVQAVSNAPEQAWVAARNAMPSVQDLRGIELSEIDWESIAASGLTGAEGVVDGVTDAAAYGVDWVHRWWTSEEN